MNFLELALKSVGPCAENKTSPSLEQLENVDFLPNNKLLLSLFFYQSGSMHYSLLAFM